MRGGLRFDRPYLSFANGPHAHPNKWLRRKGKTNGSAAKAKNGSAAKAKTQPASYDAFKEFEGKKYTGMKIGRGHKWQYGAGEWREKKVTPDKWEFHYDVRKTRTGKAPEGSGVPVGTQYHWYILAHQTATKLDANNYTTEMTGMKHKLAHKRADKPTWSASERAQRKRLIQILKTVIADLESDVSARDGSIVADSSPAPESAKPAEKTSAAGVSRAARQPTANGKRARTAQGSATTTSKSARPSKATASKSKQRPNKSARISSDPERRRAA